MQALDRELAAAQAALAAAGAAASAQPSQAAAAPPHAQPSAPPPVPAMPQPHAVSAAAAEGLLPGQAPMCAEACHAAAALGELQRRLARTHGRLLSRDASARKYKASTQSDIKKLRPIVWQILCATRAWQVVPGHLIWAGLHEPAMHILLRHSRKRIPLRHRKHLLFVNWG